MIKKEERGALCGRFRVVGRVGLCVVARGGAEESREHAVAREDERDRHFFVPVLGDVRRLDLEVRL